MLLLDTGIRATELCELVINQVDMNNKKILIFGKGAKERIVPVSAQTAQALWKYMATRPSDLGNDLLFVSKTGSRLERDDLCRLITRLGKRAGVPNAHPHRFRHTFSINFLRNGGNMFVLQSILGHSTMSMIKKYLALAQADVEAGHKQASSVAHWKL